MATKQSPEFTDAEVTRFINEFARRLIAHAPELSTVIPTSWGDPLAITRAPLSNLLSQVLTGLWYGPGTMSWGTLTMMIRMRG